MQKFLVCLALFIPALSQAQKVSVFEVRKNLKLSDRDKSYKDYYVSGGFNEGMQKGMVIDVVRRVPIHDGLKNQSQGDLVMTVAKIQILHVQQNMSVGRLFRSTTPRSRPIADFNAIMVGDELDMNTAAMPVKKKRRKNASVKPKRKPLPPAPEPELAAPKAKPAPQPAKAPAVPQPPTPLNVG